MQSRPRKIASVMSNLRESPGISSIREPSSIQLHVIPPPMLTHVRNFRFEWGFLLKVVLDISRSVSLQPIAGVARAGSLQPTAAINVFPRPNVSVRQGDLR